MYGAILKYTTAVLLTTTAVWALVFAWWQGTDFQPSNADLALFLGGIPLALIGGFVLLNHFIRQLRAPADSPAGPVSTAAADGAGSPLASAETAPQPAIVLLADCLVTAAGRSADDLLRASEAGRRPGPDSRLHDMNGFPQFAARVEEVDDAAAAAADAFGDVCAAALDLPESARRELGLLAAILPDALAQARMCLAAVPGATLRISWLVSETLHAAGSQSLVDWFEAYRREADPELEGELAIVPARDELAALELLERTARSGGRNGPPRSLELLVATWSAVADDAVRQLERDGRLFSAANQDRLIPGEAAAAILFVVASPDSPSNAPVLASRMQFASRERSADERGRVSGAALAGLMARVLADAHTPAAAVTAVVSDADHRATRSSELHAALGEDFAALDPIADFALCGTVGGYLHFAGPLVALACARSLADGGGPVLCLSQQHPYSRAALLLLPHQPALDALPIAPSNPQST